MTMSYLEDRHNEFVKDNYTHFDGLTDEEGVEHDLNEIRQEAVKEFYESLLGTSTVEDGALREAVTENLPALFDEDGEQVKDDVVDDACKAAQEWFGAE